MESRQLRTLILLFILLGILFELFKRSTDGDVFKSAVTKQVREEKTSVADWNNLTQSTPRPSAATYTPPPIEPDQNTITAKVEAKQTGPVKTDKKAEDKKKKKKKNSFTPTPPTAVAKHGDADKPVDRRDSMGGGYGSNSKQILFEGKRDTVEEWLAYILEGIDTQQRVLELVQSYKSDEISPEVFYPVIAELAANPSTEIQGFALAALSATPSTESFRMLVDIHSADRYAETIKAQIPSALNEYGNTERLTVLVGLLDSNEDTDVLLAAINQSQRIVSSRVTANARTGRAIRDNDRHSRGAQSAFGDLRVALTLLSGSSAIDLSVRSAAGTALAYFSSPSTSPRRSHPPLNGRLVSSQPG